MNQIPNIEETQKTRDKFDEIVLDFNQKFYYEHQQRGLTRLRDDVVGWLRTTLHHQLQKAREEAVREELEKFLNTLNDNRVENLCVLYTNLKSRLEQKEPPRKTVKVDLKQILKEQANWKHHDFGTVADFVSGLGEDGVIDYRTDHQPDRPLNSERE